MLQCVGRVGQVTEQLQTDVLVKFVGVDRAWRLNPAVLSPAVLSLAFCQLLTRCNVLGSLILI